MKRNGLIISLIGLGCIMGCTQNIQKKNDNIIPVKTMSVQASSEAGTLTYVGTIEESSGSQLSFSSIGTVSQVLVDEGQGVRRGQALAVLDKTTAQSSYDMAKSTLSQVQDAYDRLKALYDKGSLTDVKWIEIQTKLTQAQAGEKIAAKNLKDCILRAPFDGYISERKVDEGNNVMPGIGCFKLVKIDRVKVKISIPEKEISTIHKGQAVNFTVSALEDKSFTGKVSEIGVQADLISHTYDVRLELANPGRVLLPGMVCNATMVSKSRQATIIPQDAVKIDGSDTFVWIAKGNKAEKRIVSTGGVSKDGVIITDGLAEGEDVIISGQDYVSEGTKIIVL